MPKTELQRLADTNALDNHLNPDLGKYSHLLDEPTRQNKEIGQVEANKVFLEKKFGLSVKNTDPKVLAGLFLLRLQEIQIHENTPTVFTVSQDELILKNEIEFYLDNLTSESLSLDEAVNLLENQESRENGVSIKIKELRETLGFYNFSLKNTDQKTVAYSQILEAIKFIEKEIKEAEHIFEVLKKSNLN